MELVKVVIPIYKNTFTPLEKRSLRQVYEVLYSYPLVVIHPETLDLSALREEYPRLSFSAFEDAYFNGIHGYNQLMLSPLFYERFLDSTYILIYQLDAFVFRDELREWCAKGYDYIGAPWLRKPIYDMPVIRQYMDLAYWLQRRMHIPSKQDLHYQIGNGGFSLRKVESHLRILREPPERIARYRERDHHLYNEDVFWANEPLDFIYPTVSEALRFSFDKYPAYCYKLTKGQLPFGCHAWYSRKMRRFWKPIIRF